MSTIKMLSGDECRQTILEAINTIHDPVASTLGPMGKTVAIGKFDVNMKMVFPRTTKDGATVAKAINPQEHHVATIVNQVKQAALKTELTVGDGTSSAVVLVKAIYENAMTEVSKGVNPHAVKKMIDESVEKICDDLTSRAIPVEGEMLTHVATISANGDAAIGKIVAEAYSHIRESGIVVADKSKTGKTYVESISGLQFSSHTSQLFFNDRANFRSILEDAIVVITNEDIVKIVDIQNLTKHAGEEGRPFFVICDNLRGEAFEFLKANAKNLPPFCFTTIDMARDKSHLLQDIAIATGATVLDKAGKTIAKSTPAHYGRAEKMSSYSDRTMIIGSGGDKEKIALRVEFIKGQLESPDLEPGDKESLEQRLAGLDGGVSRIYVGAITDVEEGELFDRYEDAIRAVGCARKDGIVSGGGVMLASIMSIPEFMFKALWEPIAVLGKNGGFTTSVTPKTFFEKIKMLFGIKVPDSFGALSKNGIVLEVDPQKTWYGYDFKNDRYCDLIEAGIIEPVSVPITALKNAASVAGALITTDNIIVYV